MTEDDNDEGTLEPVPMGTSVPNGISISNEMESNTDSEIQNWENYNTYLLGMGLSASSIRQYISQARKFLRLYYSDMQEAIKSGIYEPFFQKINLFMQVKRHADGTADRANKRFALYALKRFFAYIEQKDMFQQYYEKYGKHIHAQPRKIVSKEITPSQILMLYEKLDEPFKTIMALQYETGARISEILSLKPENVTSDGNAISLTVRVKGGGKRQLSILNKTAIDSLNGLMRTAGNGWIFHEPDGTKISLDDVNYIYSNIGLEFFDRPLTSHWLRHSRGVHIYNRNHDILEVKEALGHADIKTTYTYLKSAGVLVKDIMRKNPVPW